MNKSRDSGSEYCPKCVPDVNRENLLRQAKLGRIATHSAIAEARLQMQNMLKHCANGIPPNYLSGSMRTSIDVRYCLSCRISLLSRFERLLMYLIRMPLSSDEENAYRIPGIGFHWPFSRVRQVGKLRKRGELSYDRTNSTGGHPVLPHAWP